MGAAVDWLVLPIPLATLWAASVLATVLVFMGVRSEWKWAMLALPILLLVALVRVVVMPVLKAPDS
jgi:hypothetical protein